MKKQLSYYKFFERDLAEVPQEKLDILNKGVSKIPAVPFEKRNLYLAGADEEYCQVGYGVWRTEQHLYVIQPICLG